jgi:hypothetical protein
VQSNEEVQSIFTSSELFISLNRNFPAALPAPASEMADLHNAKAGAVEPHT